MGCQRGFNRTNMILCNSYQRLKFKSLGCQFWVWEGGSKDPLALPYHLFLPPCDAYCTDNLTKK